MSLPQMLEKIKWRLGLSPGHHADGVPGDYWTRRVKKFGARAAINVSHPAEKFEEVTRRDKDEIFPYLSKLLTGDERVALDFGCGSGRFTPALARLIHGRAIGVEATEEYVKFMLKHEDVEYRIMKEGRIPLPDQSADLVWIYAVLGCIQGEPLARAVREIERALKSGGLLFLVENSSFLPDKDCYSYRRYEDYKALLPFVSLSHVRDYFDIGAHFRERFSIMAGRKI